MKLAANSLERDLCIARGTVAVGNGALAVPLGKGSRWDRSAVRDDFAVVDAEDAALVRDHRWSLNAQGYARRWDGGNGDIRMHREIMGLDPSDKRTVDHINGDRIDNRRENLRVCTKGENLQNKTVKKPNTSSRYRGVSRYGDHRWRAYAKLNRQQFHLGYFNTEQEAAEVASNWRRTHMPFSIEPELSTLGAT